MKKVYLLILFLLFTAISLEASVIYLSNQKATDSIEVSQMKQEMAALEEKNRHLRQELLQFTSLKNVASKAAELGFNQSTEFISLDKSDSFAAR